MLATLLHEAAHGLAFVRGIEDTSRQGRYHNRRYRVLAEELGLEVTEAGAFGWSSTTLREATVKQYRRELVRLRAALTLYRRGERSAGGGKSRSTNLLACLPACLLVCLSSTHPGGSGDAGSGSDPLRDL